MAVGGAHDGARGRGRRALLLGPARLRELTRAAGAALAAALALAGCALPGAAHGPASGQARVVKVTDGDTVRLTTLGKVRLIGVDTPEVFGRTECYGAAASAFTERMLPPGRVVRYRIGTESRDRYGRVLAYVWLTDGTFFNLLLAERGYATPLTIPPNVEYAHQFVAASHRAREAGRGLWSSATCAGLP